MKNHMTQAERDLIAQLYVPFAAEDHEVHPYHNFIYLKEEAINTRLTSVFGLAGWSKVVTEHQWLPTGEPCVMIAKEPIPLSWYEGRPGYRIDHSTASVYKENTVVAGRIIEDDAITVSKEDVTTTDLVENNVTMVQMANALQRIPLSAVDKKYKIDYLTGGIFSETSTLVGKIKYDIPVALTYGYLEVNYTFQPAPLQPFITRKAQYHSVGADVLTDLGKEIGTKTMNTYKASDTDLLKRLARQVGVGLYLTGLPDDVNKDNLGGYLFKAYGVFTTAGAAQKQLLADTGMAAPALREALDKFEITDMELRVHYNIALKMILAGKNESAV